MVFKVVDIFVAIRQITSLEFQNEILKHMADHNEAERDIMTF